MSKRSTYRKHFQLHLAVRFQSEWDYLYNGKYVLPEIIMLIVFGMKITKK